MNARGLRIAALVALACIATARIDHTISHRTCPSPSPSCTGPTDCAHGQYTSVYFKSTIGDGPVQETDTITVVSANDNGQLSGNPDACPRKTTCQKTTPTTVSLTTGTLKRTYHLQSHGNTYPWMYYAEVNATESMDTSCIPPSPSPTSHGFTFIDMMDTLYETPPTPGNVTFPGTEFACVNTLDYEATPWPGPGTLPSLRNIDEYCPGGSPCAFDDTCNTCINTSQALYTQQGGSQDIPGCFCRYSMGTTENIYSAVTYMPVQIIWINTQQGFKGCTLYSINLASDEYNVSVSVTTDSTTNTVEYARSLGSTECSDAASTGVGVSVTGMGYEAEPLATGLQIIPDGSRLIACPNYDGTWPDISRPAYCNGADDYNLWFYIPPQYAMSYGTNGGQYGATVPAITRYIHDTWDSSITDCGDATAFKSNVPGYVTQNKTAALYGKTPGQSNCSNQQQDVDTPYYDADEVCYTSVSLATMFYTVTKGTKDQWLLPGMFDGTALWSAPNGINGNGGVIYQEPAASAPSPSPVPGYDYTLRVDISDSIMQYLENTSDPISITAPPAGYNCGFYANSETTPGQIKIQVCNAGLGNGDVTMLQFDVNADCDPAVVVQGNETVKTVPLAVGDCTNVFFTLLTNETQLVYENVTVDSNVTDAEPGTEVLVPPVCTLTVSTDASTPPAADAVQVFCNALYVPKKSSIATNPILWGLVAFALGTIGLVAVLLWLTSTKKTDNAALAEAALQKKVQ